MATWTNNLKSSATWSNNLKSSIVDVYSELNYDGDVRLDNSASAYGQAFTSQVGLVLDKVQFYLSKFELDTPLTGNIVAKLYNITGIYGSNAKPTGSALATSDNVDVSTLPSSNALITFVFSTPYTLGSSSNYFITIEYSGGSANNFVSVGSDSSSSTHSGNSARFNGSWQANSIDICFYVNGIAPYAQQVRHGVFLTLADLADQTFNTEYDSTGILVKDMTFENMTQSWTNTTRN